MSVHTDPPLKNQTLREIKEISQDLLDLMKNMEKRALGGTQKNILINRQLNHLTYLFNQVVNDFSIPVDEKAETILQSLPLLMESFNHLPTNPEYQNLWYQLSSTVNFFLLILVNLRGKLDQRKIQGTANILATLLLGLRKIEQIPELPPIDDPSFLKSLAIFYNSLQTTATVYMSIVMSLETIKKDDLITWSNLAFWHYHLHEKFIERYPPQSLLTVLTHSHTDVYNRVMSLLGPRLAVLEFAFFLQKTFGNQWPTEINSYGLLTEHSMAGLQALANRINQEITDVYNMFIDAHKRGIIDRNDDPRESPVIQIILFTQKQMKTQLHMFTNIHSFLLNGTDLSILHDALTDSFEILQMFSEFSHGNFSMLFQSQFGEFFIEQLEYHFGILGLISKHESFQRFTTEYQKITSFLEQIPKDSYPRIILLKNLMFLYVYSHYPSQTSHQLLKEIMSELKELEEYLFLFPRDLLATKLLITLLHFILDNPPLEELQEELEDIEKTCIINGYQFHIEESFTLYKESLLMAFQDLSPSYDFAQERFKLIPLDVRSWLIPDMNALQTKTATHLLYIPFNLKQDAVS